MNEVQSVNTAQTGLTMITLMKEEMTANRKEANEQMQLMQTQMNMFQTMMTAPLPSTTTTTSTNRSDSASPQSESHSADTQVTQTTQHEHNTRSKQREIPSTPNRTPPALQRLTQPTDNFLTRTPIDLFTQPEAPAQPPEKEVDTLMHEQQPHLKPISTGLTPPPKKFRSAQKRLENRKLNDEFDDVQSFHESAKSQGAAVED